VNKKTSDSGGDKASKNSWRDTVHNHQHHWWKKDHKGDKMISQETDNKTITQDQQPEPSLKYKLHKAPFKNASPAYTDVII